MRNSSWMFTNLRGALKTGPGLSAVGSDEAVNLALAADVNFEKRPSDCTPLGVCKTQVDRLTGHWLTG